MPQPGRPQGLEELLDFLKRTRGFDFGGYKRPSLERRLAKRMDEVGVASYGDYQDFLEVHPEELVALFDTILINVTGFFRDASAWEYLAGTIVPRMLAAHDDGGPLRLWCAGCASGEETYTVAMVLAEALGEQAFLDRVKIYATDVDEQALDEARAGVYPIRRAEAIPDALRERYFTRLGGRVSFRRDLRRSIVFGRNDLVQDAPISRVDLLLCRNTLMYFTAESRDRILRRFHFALNPTGFLFLGTSEMLINHAGLFVPADVRRRVFTKVVEPTMRERILLASQTAEVPPADDDGAPRGLAGPALEAAPVAQLVVDRAGTLVVANAEARSLLGVASADVGRPLRDLDVAARPVELRAALDEACAQGRAMSSPEVELRPPSGPARVLRAQVTPLLSGELTVGASIAYLDLTAERRLQDENERGRKELTAAYEELQSSVEELETTNEELQSTNEELETTNEELQSTNEELETINDELRQRTLELDGVNAFCDAIVGGLGIALLVTDRTQRVRLWNRPAEDLWGLRADEAEGAHVLALDIGAPVAQLAGPLRDVLAGAAERRELVLDATDRRGRAFRCRLVVLPLATTGGATPADVGAVVLMEQAGEAGPAG